MRSASNSNAAIEKNTTPDHNVYNILLLFAYLPLWLHYCFATLLWPVVYYLFRYRVKVVRRNLHRSFPDKSSANWKGNTTAT